MSNPKNPLIYNGQHGFTNLTVQSTGHATLVETADGKWYASLLARRNINGHSPLGRETFLVDVTWEDGWPVFNHGKPLLLSASVETASNAGPSTKPVPSPWTDEFDDSQLDPGWYQLRTPYTQNFQTFNGRLVLKPNVFSLSERDVPAAILRKQKSLNMTFSAELLGFKGKLGPRNRVGISSYLSEFQHQDIGVRGCVNSTAMCLYTEVRRNETLDVSSPLWLSLNDTWLTNKTVLANAPQRLRPGPVVRPEAAHPCDATDVLPGLQLQKREADVRRRHRLQVAGVRAERLVRL